jgi:uncharacterized BrkB/YihY/UPF0761 family membrane protein
MRWKLVILASLITALAASGAWFLLARLVFNLPLFLTGNWFYFEAAVLILIINTVSISIYRRTSRRRKTQAFIASMLTLALIFAFLFAFEYLFRLIAQNSA